MLVFFIVTLGTMLLVNLAPGDPAAVIAGDNATPDVLATVRQQYGFDKPIFERYGDWLRDISQGNLGESYLTRQPVSELIKQRLPVTLELAIMALIMSVLVVIPLGLFIAYRQETFVDRTAVAGSSLLLAVPGFVLAIVLLTIFGINWDILPVSGWVPISENLAQNLQHALLPAIVLAVGESVVLLPVLRSDVINTLQQEYIALARAKGLNPSRILFRHALRPSSISLITLLGLTLARLIGGTVIVESIFALPGVGSLLVQSIETKDLVAVQGIVMFIAIVYLITNFVVDVLYTRLDPRVALQ